MNALSNKKVSYAELVFSNLAICAILAFFEKRWFPRHELTQSVLYENIDLIRPENRAALLDDLRKRTGLDVRRVTIGEISFLRDTAHLTLFYLPEEHPDYRGPLVTGEAEGKALASGDTAAPRS